MACQSVDDRITKLTEELKVAVEKHNQALEVVNTEKEKAFGLQKQLELLNEMKAEENPEEATVTEVV
jgi:antitoxin component of MazEF toxin-antitoxin module